MFHLKAQGRILSCPVQLLRAPALWVVTAQFQSVPPASPGLLSAVSVTEFPSQKDASHIGLRADPMSICLI